MGKVNLIYDLFLSDWGIACNPVLCILFYSMNVEKYREKGVFEANGVSEGRRSG
jgi:hypothetical protein